MANDTELQALKKAVIDITEHVEEIDEFMEQVTNTLRAQGVSFSFSFPRKLDGDAIRASLKPKGSN